MEKLILRNNPLFKFILKEDSFEINNTDYRFKNGVYKFEELKSIELKDKKLDWFPTLFGNFIGIFLGGQAGHEVSDAKFIFYLHSGKKMEIKLIDCDFEIANHVMNRIKTKIHS